MIQNLVDNLELAVDDAGYVKVDEMQQTNVVGLWAAGEVSGCCSSGLEAAAAGSRAAFAIVRTWFE